MPPAAVSSAAAFSWLLSVQHTLTVVFVYWGQRIWELEGELCGQVVDCCGQPTNSYIWQWGKIEYFRNSFYKILARPVPDQCQIFWEKKIWHNLRSHPLLYSTCLVIPDRWTDRQNKLIWVGLGSNLYLRFLQLPIIWYVECRVCERFPFFVFWSLRLWFC